MSLEPGSTFGPYRIVGPLGRGGMATVYRAHDPALDRHVALKVLPAEFLHDPTFAERFRQEARVAARLEHPHVVPIHGFGIDEGRPWMALRLLGGGSLADRLRKGPLAPAEVARILAEIASALDAAHARGIVHRDLKPANILLDENGRAYLADFGIARVLEGSAVATATGMVQGTPAYMAPEQAMGTKAEPPADVYALGVVAFECLTGRVPYTGQTPVAVLMKHVSDPVPEPRPGEVPQAVTPVLRRCLAKNPGERWPSAQAFTEALSRETARFTAAPTVEDVETLAAPVATPAPLAGPPSGPAAPAPALPGRGLGRTWTFALLGLGAAACVLLAGVAAHVFFPSAPRVTTEAPPSPAAPSPRPAEATVAPAPPPAVPEAAPTPVPSPSVQPTTTPAMRPTPMPARPTPSATPRASLPPVRAATPSPTPVPAPAAPAPAPATSPQDLATLYKGGAAPRAKRAPGKTRVFLEAKLEPTFFRKASEKDVSDSVADLREAFEKHAKVAVVDERAAADAVVQVLERGRQPATIGARKVRVRVIVGGATVELVGQDGMTGFNTWSGAAGGAAKQVESWLAAHLPTGRDEG